MDNTKTKAIVALLPQEDGLWSKVEPTHMTMIYVGEIETLKVTQYNELAKDIASIALLSNPVMAKVMGTDVMGDDERVDVLLISPTPEILAMRRMLEKWEDGEFSSFEPHVTVGPEGTITDWNSQSTPLPIYLVFDRITLIWGEDRLTLWLRKY